MTAAAQHREEGVSGLALERASGQAAVSFHVPDHPLDGTSPSQQFRDRLGYAAPRTADEDLHVFDAMTAVAAIDKCHVQALVGQDLQLFQRLVQGVAVIKIAWHCPHNGDEAAFGGRATLTFVPTS